jgi:hypothetical protein
MNERIALLASCDYVALAFSIITGSALFAVVTAVLSCMIAIALYNKLKKKVSWKR